MLSCCDEKGEWRVAVNPANSTVPMKELAKGATCCATDGKDLVVVLSQDGDLFHYTATDRFSKIYPATKYKLLQDNVEHVAVGSDGTILVASERQFGYLPAVALETAPSRPATGKSESKGEAAKSPRGPAAVAPLASPSGKAAASASLPTPRTKSPAPSSPLLSPKSLPSPGAASRSPGSRSKTLPRTSSSQAVAQLQPVPESTSSDESRE